MPNQGIAMESVEKEAASFWAAALKVENKDTSAGGCNRVSVGRQ